MKRLTALGIVGITLVGTAQAAGPMPIGTSTITVSYETSAGVVSFSRDYDFSGGFPGDATRLGDAPNLSGFNSAGSTLGVFGRRALPILLNNPSLPPVFRPNDSLVTHALFKTDNNTDFFPDYAGGLEGDITVTVENIRFEKPVVLLRDTLMLHAKWTAEQADEVFFLTDEIYVSLDNHHTAADPYRDFDTFEARVFFDFPVPNYILDDTDVQWTITGDRTDTLSLSVTFPYALLKNLEATVEIPPSSLPTPLGFLEPFHFHIEYCVAPAISYTNQAATTKVDFFRGGSQPSESYEQILSSHNCGICHGGDDASILINKPWAGSMHALSARDPLWFACMTVAEQDAAEVGDMCIRCHVPRAWISGRSAPTDGSAINATDRDSVTCHFCHRMVDPFYKPGISPIEDEAILNNILELPVTNGSASFVLDPADGRRSKRGALTPHTNIVSPFFEESALCETCHDVSNPAASRLPDDTYVGNDLDSPHPTGDKYDMFPGERTFSEWSISEYARKGVDAGGRFGGNKQIVGSCQDCHMPDSTSLGALGGPLRHDMADHGMYGGGTWIPLVIANMYPDAVDIEAINAGVEGSRSMLQRAASMELSQSGDALHIRVINETGHKLPTGQPEGRQMWINVQFFDDQDVMIAERGAYDQATGKPTLEDTKMYEILLGIDESTAQAVGLRAGHTHHIAFTNVILKDSRIPPRGFTNAELNRVQSPVVGTIYEDGQYWDNTSFMLPENTARVNVALYYKTASTEFIEFLRDANHTNDAGQVLYEQWEATGKSPPVEMVADTLVFSPFYTGDFTGDGQTDANDLNDLVTCLQGPGSGPALKGCRPGDLDGDNDVDLRDTARFLRRVGAGM